MVNDSAKDGGPKDYKTAHAYVNKQLKTPGLTPLQKQQVMAARFWLYRNEGKRDQALKTLTDIARISPKTLMGIGAQELLPLPDGTRHPEKSSLHRLRPAPGTDAYPRQRQQHA